VRLEGIVRLDCVSICGVVGGVSPRHASVEGLGGGLAPKKLPYRRKFGGELFSLDTRRTALPQHDARINTKWLPKTQKARSARVSSFCYIFLVHATMRIRTLTNTSTGAPDAAPKAKKARKSDDIAAPKPAKAPKAAPAPAESKPVKAKAARKTAADFFSDDDAPAAKPANGASKPAKGKKAKAAITITGDVPEVVEAVEAVVEAVKAQEKPKKQGKKAKGAAVEGEVIVEVPATELPKEKATKAKKGKKAEAAPVEVDATAGAQEEAPAKKPKKTKGKKQAEPVEEDVEEPAETDSEEADGEVDEDDQTAALLAGFESDDDDKDPEDDDDFDADAVVPNIGKKERTALEKALKGVKSNEPGVVYVGYDTSLIMILSFIY
jgi:hypothetical protein